jgi:hypothetical protein
MEHNNLVVNPKISWRVSMKRINYIPLPFLLAIFIALSPAVRAQTSEVITSGLILPVKVILAGNKSLLVSESGTMTPNTGRVSLINRNSGNRRTLIDGLPSGVNNLGGELLPTGPSGLVLVGRSLYMTIAVGDAVQNVGPGLESPNPNPSSPLYNSVLRIILPGDYENLAGPFTLSPADQEILASGRTIVLTNSGGQRISIRMIINLPNFRKEPRDNAPENVRSSNPYAVEFFEKNLYIADASYNRITRVSTVDGSHRTFVKFGTKTNPLFPDVGGPEVEAVPDNIHRMGNQLLVPLLTGFPFVQGLAEIRSINLNGGKQSVLISNLTSAIDVLPTGISNQFFTLEFSVNQLQNEPGRLRFYSSPDTDPVTLVSDLVSPTSMAHDKTKNAIFITHIFPGLITRVTDLP